MDKYLIVIFLMDVLRCTMGNDSCPKDFIYNSEVLKCYQFTDGYRNISTAESMCRSGNSQLAVPRSQTEENIFLNLISDAGHEGCKLWLGLKRQTPNTDWKYLDGKTPKYTNWKSGEPKVINSNCVAAVITRFQDFDGDKHWEALECSNKDYAHHVCEYKNELGAPRLSQVGPEVDPDTDVQLNCLADSSQNTMERNFYRDGTLISSSPNAKITLRSVEFKDSGSYSCQVKSPNGHLSYQSQSQRIIVREIPVISTNPTSRSIEPGSTLEFSCTMKTRLPGMTYTFYYKGNKFQSGVSYVIRKSNMEFENSGAYTCDVLYKGIRSDMSAERVIIVPGCPVPEGDDEYMRLLLSSITPREETTRWGTAQNKENLAHDEL